MKIFTRTFKFLLILALAVAALGLFGLASIISSFPSDQELRSCMITKMYRVDLCPSSRNYVPLANISPFLIKSVVTTEDGAFWTHQGFDFEEMKRSLQQNIKVGKYKRGGSTITQQVAKNLFLTEEKTLTRKAREAIITLRLEKVLTKKEILERYLNVVHFGKDLFGVKAAAEFYFQKSPADLNLVESAFLTFLLPSPEKYSISYSKKHLTEFAEMRLKQIMGNLYQYQKITDAEYAEGLTELSHFLNDQENSLQSPADDTGKEALPSEEEMAPSEEDQ